MNSAQNKLKHDLQRHGLQRSAMEEEMRRQDEAFLKMVYTNDLQKVLSEKLAKANEAQRRMMYEDSDHAVDSLMLCVSKGETHLDTYDKAEEAYDSCENTAVYSEQAMVIEDGIRAIIENEYRKYYVVKATFDTSGKVYTYKLARWLDAKTIKLMLENGRRVIGVVTVGGIARLNMTMVTITEVKEVKYAEFNRTPSAVIAIPEIGKFEDLVAATTAANEAHAEISRIIRNKDRTKKLEELKGEIPDMKESIESYEKIVRDSIL